MTRINLLPWREERRRQREREFFVQLGAAFVLAMVFVLLWSLWIGMRVSHQDHRNAYLRVQVRILDTKIARINKLDKVRSHLLARKQIIETFQSSRSKMVRLFAEIAKTIPDSVRLTGLRQNGQLMTLDGVARSYASVAQYMRSLQNSPWMEGADLNKVENVHQPPSMPYSFDLRVVFKSPKRIGVTGLAGKSKQISVPLPSSLPGSMMPVSSGTAVQRGGKG